ncbi:MAG: hypothetical protein M1828_001334 [Chrysothrix sp. TS-e1954]|nr:MAG: hypothetical protein M1828_001334 [Chrysothrix sp. TS-e1954]
MVDADMTGQDGQSNSGSNSELDYRASMGNYHKLSTFMGSFSEMNIVRRFGTLQAQNILYLQAELAHLEDQLEQIREEDRESGESGDSEKTLYPRCWRTLSQQLEDGDHTEQYEKVLEIRAKLKEYNEALAQYADICKLHNPTKHDLNALRYWLVRPEGGDCFLSGLEAEPYLPDSKVVPPNDLVTLSSEHRERDLFSAFLADNVTTWMQRSFRWWTKSKNIDPETAGLQHYKDSKINAIAHFIGTFIASMLPAASIFVLYYVNSMIDRLCIILALSALFSFSLAIFTKAKRVEIFAATAAFASVQVVFIGTTGGQSPTPGITMNLT